jgi:hypothetical protein
MEVKETMKNKRKIIKVLIGLPGSSNSLFVKGGIPTLREGNGEGGFSPSNTRPPSLSMEALVKCVIPSLYPYLISSDSIKC